MKGKLENLKKLVKNSKKILITSHRDPDFDAVSSVVAVHWILKSMGKTDITMVLENSHPFTSEYIQGSDLIEKHDLKVNLEKYDLIFLLDANDPSRFTTGDLIFTGKQKIIRIDHHPIRSNMQVDLDFSDANQPSTCDIVYKVFKDFVSFSPTIAKALLTGIVDDTKNFSIRGVSKNTFLAAYDLIEAGANIAEISEYLKQYDDSILNAVKEILNNLQFDEKLKYSYSFIPRDVYEENKITDLKMDKITDLVTDFLLGKKDYRWGFLIRPKTAVSTKISLRSRYKAQNVRLIAEHLGGGGHDEAAGATFDDIEDPYEALAITRKKVEEF